MKPKLRLLRGAIRRRNWRASRFIIRTIVMAALWPFCRKCGKFGWFGGSACCWRCQRENLLRAVFDADEVLDALDEPKLKAGIEEK